MERPWLLDLFAGAGGAGEGYRRAGFHVVAVDIDPKPLRHNPHEWYMGDALDVLDTLLAGETWQGYRLHDFAAIHASPPCQFTTHARYIQGRQHPDLLAPTRQRLQRMQGVAWVIENVSEAPMPHFLTLCGTHFDLRVYRHRQFESSELLLAPGPCHHPAKLLPGFRCIYGNTVRGTQTGNRDNHYTSYSLADGCDAMGIDWPVTHHELSQVIPPAYTRWIGEQLIAVVRQEAA